MTPIDLLVQRLAENGIFHSSDIAEANELFKQQIIDARQDGHDCTYAEYGETPKCYLEGSNEQYYKETFKQQEL
jgi:hypothetical protein